MIGQRLPDDTDWSPSVPIGAYWRRVGIWWAVVPNGLVANLSAHEVTEHEDGTITVSPSILVTYKYVDFSKSWHGYLERGVWREC